MADILDLLSDNSSNPKISTGKKGGFLSVLKKNSMLDNDINKPNYAFDKAVNKSLNFFRIWTLFLKI